SSLTHRLAAPAADPLAVALGSVALAWPRRSTKLLELRRSETIAQNFGLSCQHDNHFAER
ncbi:hypothetical protein, partial [Achromobacter xylosoxidans]